MKPAPPVTSARRAPRRARITASRSQATKRRMPSSKGTLGDQPRAARAAETSAQVRVTSPVSRGRHSICGFDPERLLELLHHLEHRQRAARAEVQDREAEIAIERAQQPVDQVVDVREVAQAAAVAVDGNRVVRAACARRICAPRGRAAGAGRRR